MSSIKSSANGMFTALKNGAPTVIFSPRTHSERMGNNVPHSTENAMPISTRLLYKNAASRESIDSSCAGVSKSLRRVLTSTAETTNAMTNATRNQLPTPLCAKECTDWMTPERVMNVPRMAKRNVLTTSVTFHLRSMPRFSWIMIECKNAVPVSHGSNEAFSTGSHIHTPPHPSSTYAHHMPSTIPIVKKNHDTNAHLRTAPNHSASSRRVINAAIAKANGTVVAT